MWLSITNKKINQILKFWNDSHLFINSTNILLGTGYTAVSKTDYSLYYPGILNFLGNAILATAKKTIKLDEEAWNMGKSAIVPRAESQFMSTNY